MALSKRIRYEVLKRDNHTCRYCHATDSPLTVDHVTPVALGGTDDPSNLVAACRDCNAGKSSTSPDAGTVEDVAQDALRWAEAIKTASKLHSEETIARHNLNAEVAELWSDHCVGFGGNLWWRPSDWPETLDTFRRYGLSQNDILDSFYVMVGKNSIQSSGRWRYFCGVCWNKIGRIQEAAKAILEAGE